MQISVMLLALGVYLLSGYPILSARIIPLVMQLILGQASLGRPLTASSCRLLGLGRRVLTGALTALSSLTFFLSLFLIPRRVPAVFGA